MFERACLVRYHEIGLKGRNRAQFERRFRENLGAALVGFPVSRVERIASRVARSRHRPRGGARGGRAHRADPRSAVRLARVPSSALASRHRECCPARDTRGRCVLDLPSGVAPLQHRLSGTQHGDQSHRRRVPSARDWRRRQPVGARCDRAHRRGAGECVRVLTRDHRSRADCRWACPGGSWRLLSAGIDSPVACWRMIRRGALVVGGPLLGSTPDQRRERTSGVRLWATVSRSRAGSPASTSCRSVTFSARYRSCARPTCAFCSIGA